MQSSVHELLHCGTLRRASAAAWEKRHSQSIVTITNQLRQSISNVSSHKKFVRGTQEMCHFSCVPLSEFAGKQDS